MILQSDIIAALGGWGYFFLIIVLALLIMVFSLKVGLGAVKGNKTEMGTVFITGLLAWIILAISTWILSFFLNLGWLGFIIAIIIAILVIKSRHDTTFFGAIGEIGRAHV